MYRPADENAALREIDPFTVDPAVKERALRSHAKTQNALAAVLKAKGIDPRSPGPDDPDFDLAWEREGIPYVAEVKSLTAANQEKQLRLGVGQVLRYRQKLSTNSKPARAVIAAEMEPSDPSWSVLCSELKILLVWPGNFEIVLSDTGSS